MQNFICSTYILRCIIVSTYIIIIIHTVTVNNYGDHRKTLISPPPRISDDGNLGFFFQGFFFWGGGGVKMGYEKGLILCFACFISKERASVRVHTLPATFTYN